MRSHEIDYRIIGDDIQLVEIELDPQETVIAEAGSMMYMDQQIRFETKMGDGSNPKAGFIARASRIFESSQSHKKGRTTCTFFTNYANFHGRFFYRLALGEASENGYPLLNMDCQLGIP